MPISLISSVWVSGDHDPLRINIDLNKVSFLRLIQQFIHIKVFKAAFAMVLHHDHAGKRLFGTFLVGLVPEILKKVDDLLLHLHPDRLFQRINLRFVALFAVVVAHQYHEYLVYFGLSDVKHLIKRILAKRENLILINGLEI